MALTTENEHRTDPQVPGSLEGMSAAAEGSHAAEPVGAGANGAGVTDAAAGKAFGCYQCLALQGCNHLGCQITLHGN